MKIKLLMASMVLVAAAQGSLARADEVGTFDASGTFMGGSVLSGTVTLDQTTGILTSSDLLIAPQYGQVGSTVYASSGFYAPSESNIFFIGGSLPSDYELDLNLQASTLVGYKGGALDNYQSGTCGGTVGCSSHFDTYVNGYSDSGGSYDYDLTSGALTLVSESGSVPVSAAPEPSTWLLMFAGIGGIGLMLRRTKRSPGFRFKDAVSA